MKSQTKLLANNVSKYVGMKSHRKTRGGKQRKVNRKTRRQRGGAGALTGRITKNVLSASRETQKNPLGNYFYISKEDNIMNGYAMFIGQRFEYGAGVPNISKKPEEVKRERRAAKYPYEECVFFFEIILPDKEGQQYPLVPPHVYHKTAGIINYRLHPNLYGYGNFTEGGINEKTCLGILNTFGTPEWKGEMTIWSVLGAMQALFMENPGLSEPAWSHLTDRNPDGILYNQHVMYESIDITSRVYDMVVKSLNASSTEKNINFNKTKVASEHIPEYVKPFLEYLGKRAYSALTFLIGKLELFIEANDKNTVLQLPSYRHHHAAKVADVGALIARMKATRALIPSALRINVFPSGIGETHRALYEMSRPSQPNGTLLSYEEFVEEIQERERKVNESGRGNNGDNNANNGATAYVYSNTEENYAQNEEDVEDLS